MRYFALMMALVATVAASAEVAQDTTVVANDTLKVNADKPVQKNTKSFSINIEHGKTVQTTSENGTTIETELSDGWSITESFSIPFLGSANKEARKKKTNCYFESHLGGFYVGFSNVINPNSDFYDGNMARSVELGFVPIECEQALNSNLGICWGLGFNWRNFKIDDNYWMQKVDGRVAVEKIPDGYELKYSNLRVFSLQTPVMLELHPLNNRFHMMVGVVGDFRVGRRLVNKYFDERDVYHKETKKHVRTLPVGCDIMAQIGHKDLAFYGKFSPVSIFENSSRGPINQAFTVGVKLVF